MTRGDADLIIESTNSTMQQSDVLSAQITAELAE